MSGMPLGEVLTQLDIGPDVEGDGVVWTHRRADGADWYFVAAPAHQGFKGTLRFRSVGDAELWNPLSGEMTPAGIVRRDGKTSLVALDVPPSGSLFVVFRAGDKTALKQWQQSEENGRRIAARIRDQRCALHLIAT